ncbi:CHAT domain-containing protein [Mycena leptocephala]|nr:CHAT domain-containing protein [Mycena leptocephala]
MLNNLGNSLLTRFEQLGDLDDLNKSVSIREDAVCLTPDGHPEKPSLLNNLGNSLLTWFEQLGDLEDLNKSVLSTEDAVHLTPDGHPDKPSTLNNFGGSLFRRFERFGALDDLNKSVSIREDAVCLTPDGHPEKPSMLNNLGISLLTRFEQLGHLEDLNKSVLRAEDAVHLTPDGHPDKPSRLNNLGNSLLTRFDRLGDLDDLNKSVLRTEDAVHLTPDGHSDKPSRLSNVGISLLTRFEQLGDLDDLNKSVLRAEDAVRLTPDGHPDMPSMLNNLGNSLFRRFEQLGDLEDLNKSVLRAEDAVHLAPDGHPDKHSSLSNLGGTLLYQFQRLGDLEDLNKSVSIREDAVHLTPDGDPDKPSRLNNLGNSLFRRFERLGDLEDLNKSVLRAEDAVCLTPDGHPDKPSMLSNLGTSLFHRFERLGDHAALQNTISVYALAARSTTGPAHIRFYAASKWAEHAKIGDNSSPMDAYHVALELLPELAWLGLSISDRHHHLLKAGKVVRDGAAVAITSDQLEKAVEWLEQGRSVIWGQFLNLRSPADALKHCHPTLAHRLVSLSAQLERSATRTTMESSQNAPQPSLESVADRAQRNARERGELLKEIRQLEGFERFLLPKTISELSAAAQEGPVVILNPAHNQCDALVLIPGLDGEVMHVPLNDFEPESAGSMAQALGDLVGRSERLVMTREGQVNPEDEFAHNLSQLWKGVVKPVLDALAITVSDSSNLPRIWWCPTGPLAFLPIHAAGLYGKNDAFGSQLSDFVISSYTPSLAALIEGFRTRSKAQKALQLLAVAQPSAVGQTRIPGTQKEIDCIQQLAHGKLSVLRLDEHTATVEPIQRDMRNSSWVHFACHGVQNVSQPTESALLLAGSERLTLSKIIQLALPHADLAFLSACQTATGDKSLVEESVHLAAGMQLAGYRGVIATMWTIMDNDAPQVASSVYEHLLEVSPPDPARAAEALHLAIRKLREEGSGYKSFTHWVPFIHIGV